jgi:hypothetical protein
VTSFYRTLDIVDMSPLPYATNVVKNVWLRSDINERWSLQGIFGFANPERIAALGIIFGKDSFVSVPVTCPTLPLLVGWFSRDYAAHVKIAEIAVINPEYPGRYTMGVYSKFIKTNQEHFNALDRIKLNWKIKNIAFASVGGKLSGSRVTYANGVAIVHGAFTEATKAWDVETKMGIVACKVTRATDKTNTKAEARIGTLEFIFEDDEDDSFQIGRGT